MAELPAGASALEPVSVKQTIYFPGGVMWDGKYITLTDQDAGGNPSSPATTIYQMSEQGSGILRLSAVLLLRTTVTATKSTSSNPSSPDGRIRP